MSSLTTKAKTLVVTLSLVFSLPLLAGCDQEKKAAEEGFQAAVTALDERNDEVDAAVADLTEVMASEVKPLDESTATACEEAISAAQGAKATAPEMAKTTEEITAQTAEVEAIAYDEQLANLASAKAAYEKSVKQRELVTNPTDAFVIQRLSEVEHVQTPTAVTEEMDPNGNLNKQGGYTATVFFLSDLVDQSEVYVDEVDGTGNEVIDKGTQGGGSVEVYANETDATKRDMYLATFDGTIIANGSHTVCGTCVIRISNELTATQQKELEAAVIEALTLLE